MNREPVLVGGGPKFKTKWRCRCECGVEKHYRTDSLEGGNVISCGCARLERIAKQNLRHGLSKTPTHRAWLTLIQRCTNSNSPMWYAYGGRGIAVCDRWRSFDLFLEDMGIVPNGHSIERNDVNGDYEPNNCRWIPLALQAKNKTTTRYVRLRGQRMIQADAARALGILPQTMNKWRRGQNRQPAGLDLVFE